DLIVHQSRLKDGSRKITNITEVQGMEGDTIVMQDVFLFEQTGVIDGKIQGRLKPTGIRPKFVETFEAMGIHLPNNIFAFTFYGPAMDSGTLIIAALAAVSIVLIALGIAMSGSSGITLERLERYAASNKPTEGTSTGQGGVAELIAK